MKIRFQQEANSFPTFFAFNREQFEEGMIKLGLTVSETNKIVTIGGGGYLRSSDLSKFDAMFSRHKKEMKEAIEADITGKGFIFEMCYYELSNHEYIVSDDVEPTLDALGLTFDEVESDTRLKSALERAKKAQWSS